MTPEQKLDKYYQKKFGWTLIEVDLMFEAQGNVCAACHRPPGAYRLSVDHDHRFDKIKIWTQRTPAGWVASVRSELVGALEVLSATKGLAKEIMRKMLCRKSVRSGLCLRCNKGLQMFEDSKAPLPPAERLENLAQCLRKFSQKGPHEKDNSRTIPSNPVVCSS
jgi:hypothetical protein